MPAIASTDHTFPDPRFEEAVPRSEDVKKTCWKETRSASAPPEMGPETDAVIARLAHVNPDVLNAMTKIKAILRDWIKYDSADCAGVRKRGIPACDIPARIEMETIRALAVPVVTSA